MYILEFSPHIEIYDFELKEIQTVFQAHPSKAFKQLLGLSPSEV